MTETSAETPSIVKRFGTHSICETCWNKRHADREPVTLNEPYRSFEFCCFCGQTHRSGIYVREESSTLLCKGMLGIHSIEQERERESV